jgi:ABC-type ATPase involved in cell division
MNPKLLLAHEPTGNLRSSKGEEIMDLFNRLNAEGTTVVQVALSKRNPAHGNRVIQLRDGWIINN